MVSKKTAKTQKHKLVVEKRKVLGRKVKKLRLEGILPANVYGKKVKSLAIKLDLKSFSLAYQAVGETGLVELKVKGEEKLRPVLIHNVQFHPVTDLPLHADFYQVDLKKKVTTEVPVELVGESPAVEQKVGILVQLLTEVEVEALPTELPDKFTIDIGKLKKIGDLLVVSDLKPPAGVKILTAVKEILVKIEPPAKEEVAAPPVEEAVAEEVSEEEKESTEEAKEKAKEPAEEKPAEKKAKKLKKNQ